VPEWTPFISEIGVAGADGIVKYHAFEQMFSPQGQLTPLGRELESRMVGALPGLGPR
jgi:hypothetical protein